MDPKQPRAEAVAVRDGRFVAVGTRAEVEKAAGAGASTDTTRPLAVDRRPFCTN